MLKFDYSVSKNLAPKHNLVYSEELVSFVDPVFDRAGLTQAQVDEMQTLWIKIATFTFDPGRYPWAGRLVMALFFLGFFKSKRPHESV